MMMNIREQLMSAQILLCSRGYSYKSSTMVNCNSIVIL